MKILGKFIIIFELFVNFCVADTTFKNEISFRHCDDFSIETVIYKISDKIFVEILSLNDENLTLQSINKKANLQTINKKIKNNILIFLSCMFFCDINIYYFKNKKYICKI